MVKIGGSGMAVRLAYLVLGLGALASCGCLVVAAGAAATGGAAVGYAYYKGGVSTCYNARLEDTRAAVRQSLAELGMPVTREEVSDGGGYLESRTRQDDKVKIHLSMEASKFPAEGAVTCVAVRVGLFGDREVSERLLNQIGAHLTYNPAAAPLLKPQPALGPIQPAAAVGVPPQSPPPPLAKEPVPVK